MQSNEFEETNLGHYIVLDNVTNIEQSASNESPSNVSCENLPNEDTEMFYLLKSWGLEQLYDKFKCKFKRPHINYEPYVNANFL